MKTAPKSAGSPPGAHWYLVGVVLIVMGPIALAWSLHNGARAVTAANIRFTAPGETTVQLIEPGEYSLWRVLGEDEPAVIPEGFLATVIEPMRGAEFDLEPTAGRVERYGSTRRFEIARASIPAPGPYEIAVAGVPAPSVFEFGPSVGPGAAGGGLVAPRFAQDIGAGALTLSTILFGSLSVIGFLAGVVVLVGVWVARDRGRSGSRPDADQSQD